MTFADRITQARHDRNARRIARAQIRQLAGELAAYSSPADRAEIELLAGRSTAPDAELVRSVLDQLRVTSTVARQTV
jgi:chromosome segregation and condensation protein ScpB